MFKHRDNITHSPFTTDPRGDGVATTTAAAGTRTVAFADDANAGASLEVAGRKRPRDIRGIVKFREVVYGERGLPRLHAMVTRNPTLMYPPAHTDAARARVLARRRAAAAPEAPETDADLSALFEARRAAEEEAAEGRGLSEAKTEKGTETDEQLATYHHRQLDALIGIYYEFNHMTFMKLPMDDTLQLLQRCGKEAVAHCMEFEMHLRIQRETRLRQLDEIAAEESRLAQRRLDAQEEALARQEEALAKEVYDAEKAQQELEYGMCENKSQEHEKEEANDVSIIQKVIETDAESAVGIDDVDMTEVNGGGSEVSQ